MHSFVSISKLKGLPDICRVYIYVCILVCPTVVVVVYSQLSISYAHFN